MFSLILGTGIDLCEIARMRAALERHPRLINRLLSENERAEAGMDRLDADSLAALTARRFAAKEALVKALGGARGLGFDDASVLHNNAGKPEFVFSARLAERLPPGARAHLSISDERGHALAMVILEAPQETL